jgi:hypothetical protein
MASRFTQSVVGVMLAGSLLASSTAAVAANALPTPQANPWAALAVMSGGAPAAAVCASAAAAAAGVAMPGGCVLPVLDAAPVPVPASPPPPLVPVAAAGAGAGISPLLLALLAIAAGVGVLLAIHHNGTPNSPA